MNQAKISKMQLLEADQEIKKRIILNYHNHYLRIKTLHDD